MLSDIFLTRQPYYSSENIKDKGRVAAGAADPNQLCFN